MSLIIRPDRWLNPPETVKDVPGLWGNVLTFLGGSHSCIGYRFALIECVLDNSDLNYSSTDLYAG